MFNIQSFYPVNPLLERIWIKLLDVQSDSFSMAAGAPSLIETAVLAGVAAVLSTRVTTSGAGLLFWTKSIARALSPERSQNCSWIYNGSRFSLGTFHNKAWSTHRLQEFGMNQVPRLQLLIHLDRNVCCQSDRTHLYGLQSAGHTPTWTLPISTFRR